MAISLENRTCPICNSNEKTLLFEQSFSNFSDKNLLDSYNVVSCNKCGFCYADNIPNQETFDIYYTDMSKYEKSDTDYTESEYDLKRFRQTVEFIKSNIENKDLYTVEIGCATGLLLSLLKEDGFTNLLGIDPSPSCVATVQNKYNISSLTGTISKLNSIISGSVEILILVGVLEHIRDLDHALQEISGILKPGGKVIIVVPDASQYFNGKDAPFQEFSTEHINFFGLRSLTNLMAKYKFSACKATQQIFEVNYNTLTPVILSIYAKENPESFHLSSDKETVSNLKKYIELSVEEGKYVQNKIDNIINEHESIIIWGTGAQTLRLLANTDLKNADIVYFVDSNPKYQGNKLNNILVISPEELKNRSETILISTRAYQHEIEFQIKQTLKLSNKIIKLFK